MILKYELEGMAIFIDKLAIEKIESYCRKYPGFENGGIIIGYYSPDQTSAIVTDITGAPIDSKLGRSSFFRGIIGLKKAVKNLWKEGKYYLGEWHYHPNSSPAPSRIDNQQMIIISKDEKFACPEPILIIAGGGDDFFAYSVSVYKNGQRIQLENKK